MLKQRLLYAQCADEAELVRPIFCCLQSGTDDAENEDTIELFESNNNHPIIDTDPRIDF